jgi:hypothetical protein
MGHKMTGQMRSDTVSFIANQRMDSEFIEDTLDDLESIASVTSLDDAKRMLIDHFTVDHGPGYGFPVDEMVDLSDAPQEVWNYYKQLIDNDDHQANRLFCLAQIESIRRGDWDSVIRAYLERT